MLNGEGKPFSEVSGDRPVLASHVKTDKEDGTGQLRIITKLGTKWRITENAKIVSSESPPKFYWDLPTVTE